MAVRAAAAEGCRQFISPWNNAIRQLTVTFILKEDGYEIF
jgi:hypothetical protein